jgi:hypothetical protein
MVEQNHYIFNIQHYLNFFVRIVTLLFFHPICVDILRHNNDDVFLMISDNKKIMIQYS